MSPISIAKASLPYLVNAAGTIALTVGVAVLLDFTSKDKIPLMKYTALSVAAAVGVFFAGKAINYSTFPIAVGLLVQAITVYAEKRGYIEDDLENSLFLAAMVIPTVAVTALQRFGFLPRILL